MPLARLYSACAVAIMALLHVTLLSALPANAAPEVQANTTTQGGQLLPAIAKLTNGYIVVWISQRQDGYKIYGQRYTLNGVKVGGELRVSGLPVKSWSTNSHASPKWPPSPTAVSS